MRRQNPNFTTEGLIRDLTGRGNLTRKPYLVTRKAQRLWNYPLLTHLHIAKIQVLSFHTLTHPHDFFPACLPLVEYAPGSRLPAPGSRLPTPDSRLPAPSSRLPATGYGLPFAFIPF
jgi:hypothetical protein